MKGSGKSSPLCVLTVLLNCWRFRASQWFCFYRTAKEERLKNDNSQQFCTRIKPSGWESCIPDKLTINTIIIIITNWSTLVVCRTVVKKIVLFATKGCSTHWVEKCFLFESTSLATHTAVVFGVYSTTRSQSFLLALMSDERKTFVENEESVLGGCLS